MRTIFVLIAGASSLGFGCYAFWQHATGNTIEAIYWMAFALWLAVPTFQRGDR